MTRSERWLRFISTLKIRTRDRKIALLHYNGPQRRVWAQVREKIDRAEPIRLIILKARREGISTAVVDVHTIKPLDTETLLACIKKSKVVVTAEEAQVNGGLGDAVASLVAELAPRPMARIAVNDRFGQSGKARELLEEYGLTSRHITEAVTKLLNKL